MPVMLPDTLTVVPVWIVAEIFPPVILPVADINPPVKILPPVTLPVSDAVVPVCVVALTFAPPRILPPVMLPVALIEAARTCVAAILLLVVMSCEVIMGLSILPLIFNDDPVIVAPVMLPRAVTMPAVIKLPPDTLAVVEIAF